MKRKPMTPLRLALAAALLTAGGPALAAGTLSTPNHNAMAATPAMPTTVTAMNSDVDIGKPQRRLIWDGLKAVAAQKKPPGFSPHVGNTLPDALVMHRFSHEVKGGLPGLAGMKYVKLDGQVLVVRQRDRKIELIVHEP